MKSFIKTAQVLFWDFKYQLIKVDLPEDIKKRAGDEKSPAPPQEVIKLNALIA